MNKAKQLKWEGPFTPNGLSQSNYMLTYVGLRDPIIIEWKDSSVFSSNTPWGFVCDSTLEKVQDKVYELWNDFINHSVDEIDIEEEMKKAGMLPLDDILSGDSSSKYETHIGVTSIEYFSDWLTRKREEYIRLRIKHEFKKNDDLYDFVLGKASAYNEIWLNFRKGTKDEL